MVDIDVDLATLDEYTENLTESDPVRVALKGVKGELARLTTELRELEGVKNLTTANEEMQREIAALKRELDALRLDNGGGS